jgi:hypothetical protein
LTGLGSAAGAIRGSGIDRKDIVRSLEGEFRLHLKDGRLVNLNVMSGVFSLFDISKLLPGDRPDPRKEGMEYRTISGDIRLQDGRALTEELLIDSPTMKISMVGNVNMITGDLDLKVGFRPLGTGGRLISKVPFFGEIVTDEEGSFIQYYVEVRGTIDEPQVTGIPLESVREGVFGRLRRLLDKPHDWLPLQRHPNFERYFREKEYFGR